MTEIRWEEPPSFKRGRQRRHVAFADELRQYPDRWAMFKTCRTLSTASSTARAIRQGRWPSFPAGEFEATSRTVDGEFRVYVRYVGPVLV